MRLQRWLWVGGAFLMAGAAHGQVRRALAETAEIKAAVAKVKPDALKADPALADCAPKRHQSQDAVDWYCKVGALRLAAAAEKVDAQLPVDQNKPLLKRAKLVSLAFDAADALGFYAPQGEQPQDLPRWKVNAQWEACQAAQELFGAVLEIPEDKPAGKVLETGLPAASAPRLNKPLKRIACDCFDRVVALGRSGFLNEQKEPALVRAQKLTFAIGCNLNTTGRERSLAGLKEREKQDVDFSGVGGATGKAGDLDKDEAQRVADRRKNELKLCVDDGARGAAGSEKMMRCACPLMQRWRFPKRAVDTPLVVNVQVAEKLSTLALEINAKGMVEKCLMADVKK